MSKNVDQLIDYAKLWSVELVKRFSNSQSSRLLDQYSRDGKSELWTASLLLTSPVLSVKFRAHFDQDSARSLSSYRFGVNPDKITQAQEQDFMKEICNLCGGVIKRGLEAHNIKVSSSLPGLTFGMHVAVKTDLSVSAAGKKLIDNETCEWGIESDGASVGCSIWIGTYTSFGSLVLAKTIKGEIEEL